jgi:hypothetical protein
MRLTVTHVNVPAWSTVGLAVGVDERGVEWPFVVDHRPGRVLVEALEAGEEILVDVEDYQLLGGPMDGHA